MQLPWDDHFFNIVIPAWQAYRAAEEHLSVAIENGDPEPISRARYDVLREGGAATFYVHHFAEIVMRARPPWLPNEITSLARLRAHIAHHCTTLRGDVQVDDVALLKDVADALKHAILTHEPDLDILRPTMPSS